MGKVYKRTNGESMLAFQKRIADDQNANLRARGLRFDKKTKRVVPIRKRAKKVDYPIFDDRDMDVEAVFEQPREMDHV